MSMTLREDETVLPVYWLEIRALLLAAMAFFIWTIGIGILNGTDLIDFDQRRILGHVHGGTLGWLTLAVYAASLWLFGGDDASDRERTFLRWLAGYSVVVFALYVVAFSTTYGGFRPVMGSLSTLAIAAMFGWIVFRARRVALGVPHLGFLAAIATSVVGGVLGVLWAIQIATGDRYLPEGGEGAHPAVMVVGFLFPVALAMSEWAFSFPTPERATRLGTAQMAFPFLGGVILMLSLLLDLVPLAPIAILLEIVGVVIFLIRLWPRLRRVNLASPTPGRWALASAIGSVFVIGLAQFFVIRYEGEFDLVPPNQLLALDHAQFIGAMTSAVFAMLVAAAASRRDPPPQHHTFLLVEGGLLVFIVGLLADVTVLKQIGAPVMGVGLLIGLAAYAGALLASDRPPIAARGAGAGSSPAT